MMQKHLISSAAATKINPFNIIARKIEAYFAKNARPNTLITRIKSSRLTTKKSKNKLNS